MPTAQHQHYGLMLLVFGPLGMITGQLLKRLGHNEKQSTAVIDNNLKLQGIITDGDLRRMLQKSTNLDGVTARDIMTLNPKQIAPDDFAVKALHHMQENNITQLVVIEDSHVKGFIHLHDLLKEGIV